MYKNESNLLLSFIQHGNINSLWGNANINRYFVGNIKTPTGKIFAIDPLIISKYDKPFLHGVPMGEYPVYLSIITFDSGDQRVALSMIQFKEEKPISWELALTDGQDVSTLKEDEFFGYGVDSGTGCFMDEGAFKKFYELSDDNNYMDNTFDEMQKTYTDTWSYLNKEITEDCNIIMFSSGIGDGSYPSFWGLDEQGNICCLVTDFMILE